MKQKEMVLVCPIIQISGTEQIVLIKKERPAFQVGRLNLPGGHIENKESPKVAGDRELYEETGLTLLESIPVGSIEGEEWKVYIFAGYVKNPREIKNENAGEKVFIFYIHEALAKPNLMMNLLYIIPKCLAKLDNFKEYLIPEEERRHAFEGIF